MRCACQAAGHFPPDAPPARRFSRRFVCSARTARGHANRFVRYNGGMKKAGPILIALVFFLQALVFLVGCGGEEEQGIEEEVVDYAIQNILVPELRDSDFVVEWMRRSTGVADTSPDELGLRFWKWEGGALSEISLDEFKQLALLREGDNPQAWTYSQHSITVLEADGKEKEALVEIGSLYGPLAGSGVRYLLRVEDGEWKKISEQTIWGS